MWVRAAAEGWANPERVNRHIQKRGLKSWRRGVGGAFWTASAGGKTKVAGDSTNYVGTCPPL